MKTNTVTKVAKHIYLEQVKWSVSFIVIMIAVYIGLNIAGSYFNFSITSNFLMYNAGSSMVYMFVIGIISGSAFLPQLIKLGVTRKICVYSMMVAALLLSITLPIIFNILALIESLFTGNYEFNFAYFILYIFNIFVIYLLGWLINIGFYRFNWAIGLLFIPFAIFLNSIYALIWKSNIVNLIDININQFGTNLKATFQYLDSSFLISSLETLCLILFIIIIIKILTQKMPIKIK